MKRNSFKSKNYWYKRLTLSNWFVMLGGFILFVSWAVEKYYQIEWTEHKERLKRSQIVIDITEVNRAIYELPYSVESRKRPFDTIQIAFIQMRLINEYLDLLTWSKGRLEKDSDDYPKLVQDKQSVVKAVIEDYNHGRYYIINSIFSQADSIFRSDYLNLDSSFAVEYQKVSKKQESWNLVFLFTYILGSISLAIAFILEKLSKNKAVI